MMYKFFLFLTLSSPSFDRCSAVADEIMEPILRLQEEPSDIPAKQARIVNGDRSSPSKRPFFARAGYDNIAFTNDILCGATLIWSDILVTAAWV